MRKNHAPGGSVEPVLVLEVLLKSTLKVEYTYFKTKDSLDALPVMDISGGLMFCW